MRFEWDGTKDQSNQRKHGLSFADAPLVFEGSTLTFEDMREDYGEARYLTIGTRRHYCPHAAGRCDANYLDEESECPRNGALSRAA